MALKLMKSLTTHHLLLYSVIEGRCLLGPEARSSRNAFDPQIMEHKEAIPCQTMSETK